MITVHHLENSRSQRVIWLLELLELEYQIKRYDRDPETQLAPKELFDIHPLGKSPVIEDGGKVYAETGAIFQYLLDNYDKENQLHPAKDDSRYQDFIYFLHFAEGSLMPPLVMVKIFSVVQEKVPFFIAPIAKAITGAVRKNYLNRTVSSLFEFVEKELAKSAYFLGENLSAADVMMSFPLEASLAGRVDMKDYPHIVKFVEKIKEDEGYKKALASGGPYAY